MRTTIMRLCCCLRLPLQRARATPLSRCAKRLERQPCPKWRLLPTPAVNPAGLRWFEEIALSIGMAKQSALAEVAMSRPAEREKIVLACAFKWRPAIAA